MFACLQLCKCSDPNNILLNRRKKFFNQLMDKMLNSLINNSDYFLFASLHEKIVQNVLFSSEKDLLLLHKILSFENFINWDGRPIQKWQNCFCEMFSYLYECKCSGPHTFLPLSLYIKSTCNMFMRTGLILPTELKIFVTVSILAK